MKRIAKAATLAVASCALVLGGTGVAAAHDYGHSNHKKESGYGKKEHKKGESSWKHDKDWGGGSGGGGAWYGGGGGGGAWYGGPEENGTPSLIDIDITCSNIPILSIVTGGIQQTNCVFND